MNTPLTNFMSFRKKNFLHKFTYHSNALNELNLMVKKYFGKYIVYNRFFLKLVEMFKKFKYNINFTKSSISYDRITFFLVLNRF